MNRAEVWAKALCDLAALIREKGTCAPAALELIAERIVAPTSPRFELTNGQVAQLFDFGGKPRAGTPLEDQDVLVIQHAETGHSGPGLYAHYGDLPEEGAIYLDGQLPDSPKGALNEQFGSAEGFKAHIAEFIKLGRRHVTALYNSPRDEISMTDTGCWIQYAMQLLQLERPKGDPEHGRIDPSWSLHDRVEFALRDAGFGLDEAAFVAEAASVANGDLDSPKGGSDLIACVDRIEEAIEHRVPHDIYGTVHVELAEIRRLAQASIPKDGSETAHDEPRIWATQRPGLMPKLFGTRDIAELNWNPADGRDLICLQVVERVRAQASDAEVQP